MDPISNADNLVLLLRQKLRERARMAARDREKPETGAAKPATLQQLAAVGDIDERALRRALVQNLLAEHFGSGVLNDAQFQQIVGRVTAAVEEDSDAAKLVSQVLAELRNP